MTWGTRRQAMLFLLLSLAQLFFLQNPGILNEAHSQPVRGSPVRDWGVFFNTRGDLRITVNQSGVAVKVEVPREFVIRERFGRIIGRAALADNDTSAVESTITNDFYYYSVVDLSRRAPYDPHSPFCVEVDSPSFKLFSRAQEIIIRGLLAPFVAGIYEFAVFVTNATTIGFSSCIADGERSPVANFAGVKPQIIRVPASMGKNPSSISGFIFDDLLAPPFDNQKIRTVGVVYAIDADNPIIVARAFVNATTGFYNVTGLAGNRFYNLFASAGFFPRADARTAYISSPFQGNPVLVGVGVNIGDVKIALSRGGVIRGTLNYIIAGQPNLPIASLTGHPYLTAAGITALNYTVEVVDSFGTIVGSVTNKTSNTPVDPFTVTTKSDFRYVGLQTLGTNYSGIPAGTYTVRAYVTGYTQRDSVTARVIGTNGFVTSVLFPPAIFLENGARITGRILLLDPFGLTFETPRQAEMNATGGTSGKLYGGNVFARAVTPDGSQTKAILIINGTAADGTTLYADRSQITYHIIGFSELFNRTYSGLFINGSRPGFRDYGLGPGRYRLLFTVRGYMMLTDVQVDVSFGGSVTRDIQMYSTGTLIVTIASFNTRPGTRIPQGPVNFLSFTQTPFPAFRMRTYFRTLAGETVGYNETIVPRNFAATVIRVIYAGNNWSLREIIFYAARPSSLPEGNYAVSVYLLSYVQQRDVVAFVSRAREASQTAVILLVGGALDLVMVLISDGLLTRLAENVSVRIIARNFPSFAIRGAFVGNMTVGSGNLIFPIEGFFGGGHFWYVAPWGQRFFDYGLEAGDYSVQVEGDFGISLNEFGFTDRFIHQTPVRLTIPALNYRVGAIYNVFRMGKVVCVPAPPTPCTVRGFDFLNQLRVLSWVEVRAQSATTSRTRFTFDGNYTIHIPDGTYTITFRVPGYTFCREYGSLTTPSFTIFGSSTFAFPCTMEDPPSPSTSLSIQAQLSSSATNQRTKYRLSAVVNLPKTSLNEAKFIWVASAGALNTTVGQTVEWSAPAQTDWTAKIAVTALIPGERILSASLSLRYDAPIPEYPIAQHAQVMVPTLAAIPVLLGAYKRKRTRPTKAKSA